MRLRVAAAEPRLKRGTCVFFNGQGEFIEKYREAMYELVDRGFAVATLDWRGQGGSQRPLDNPRIGHIDTFAKYDEDARTFLREVVDAMADGPVIGLGHSMGGHMMLRTLHAMPQWFAAAVLSAPMLGIRAHGVWKPLADVAIAAHNAVGCRRRFAWKMKHRDPATHPFDVQIVTSDATRYARTQDFLKRHPEMRIFGPSWGWLKAANRSIKEVHARGYAESIQAPVMIVGAEADLVCETKAARAYASRLPHGHYLEIPDARHEILREQDRFRQTFWQAFDAFAHHYCPTY